MFDLLVIGAGPGGYTAAARAAKLGLSTAYSLPTGTQIGAGELFFTAEGSVCDLHRARKICQ